MKPTLSILSFFLLLLVFSSAASANVSLIFTEPMFKGNTEFKIFNANTSMLVASATTNGSEVVLVDGQAYIIQVMPTGVSFINDPVAGFDYLEGSLPAIFLLAIVFLMALGLVGAGLYSWQKKRR